MCLSLYLIPGVSAVASRNVSCNLYKIALTFLSLIVGAFIGAKAMEMRELMHF